MPVMSRALPIALGLLLAQAAPSLTLEIRTFDGPDDVTRETRLTVHRAGDRGQPIGRVDSGAAQPLLAVPPGIYDAQAVQERAGQVVRIRWAERLVVMPYPDEHGHHLQVINFRNGYGALQVRRHAALPDPGQVLLFPAGDRTSPVLPAPGRGRAYVLFVAPAGTYDIQIRQNGRTSWHTGVEVPRDRTRLWLAP
jgi:hypothetical protein